VLVTNDSAPQHLASARGTPTVTLFGPTVPAFGFGPLAPGSVTLGVEELACRPCDPHGPERCPLGHWRCMRELSVERVIASIRSMTAE
jgi:heptosyltransferase-2